MDPAVPVARRMTSDIGIYDNIAYLHTLHGQEANLSAEQFLLSLYK